MVDGAPAGVTCASVLRVVLAGYVVGGMQLLAAKVMFGGRKSDDECERCGESDDRRDERLRPAMFPSRISAWRASVVAPRALDSYSALSSNSSCNSFSSAQCM